MEPSDRSATLLTVGSWQWRSPADFVHVYDAKSGYEKEQEIDFFGEISGMSFSPDTESLFIGVWDRTYGSLLEFGRRRNNSYIDSIV